MNKPTGQFVMLRGPKMVYDVDGNNGMLHITIVKNDDKLDVTGYEFTGMQGLIEEWSWVGLKNERTN